MARNDRQSQRSESDERRYAARRAAAQEDLQYRGHDQTKTLSDGREEDRSSRGGGFSEVSPSGGEYLRGAPREYPGEAYPDQGFGKVSRRRNSWRVEDKVFGPDTMIHDPLPGQYRGVGPKGYRRSDDRIREDACEALSEDHDLDASSIDVSVKDGEVTLSGNVSSRQDKRRAEHLIDSIRGVRDVHNQLRIQSTQ